MNSKVEIVTKQYDKNGMVDNIKTVNECEVYQKNNDIYIVYKEQDSQNKITTTIKISSNQVSIKKFGTTNSNMTFKENAVDEIKYRTPQGLFRIETHTKSLTIDMNKSNHIKINIDYDIKIMDLFNGRNEIEILVSIKK